MAQDEAGERKLNLMIRGVSPRVLKTMEWLAAIRGDPNTATMIAGIVLTMEQFYQYQLEGYELRFVKNGHRIALRLPIHESH